MVDEATLRRNVEDTFVGIVAGGESDLAVRLIHPDFVNHEADPDHNRGPEGLIATSEWLRSCFGTISWDFHHILIDGALAAAHVTMHGTHEGGVPPGVPANHRPFAVQHVHIVRFDAGGRALEHWAVRDDIGLMRQVGLLGGPPEP